MKKLIVVAALVAVAVGWWWTTDRSTHESQKPNVAASVIATPMQTQDVTRIQDALNSADPRVRAGILSTDTRNAYAAQGQPFVPKGATVKVKSRTFRASGDAATVDTDITMPDGSTSSCMLMLVRSGADAPWLILSAQGK